MLSACVCLCLHVSLSAFSQKEQHGQTSQSFLYMLTVILARSSPDDSSIRYVLPVLWMTSCFHLMGHISVCTRYTSI